MCGPAGTPPGWRVEGGPAVPESSPTPMGDLSRARSCPAAPRAGRLCRGDSLSGPYINSCGRLSHERAASSCGARHRVAASSDWAAPRTSPLKHHFLAVATRVRARLRCRVAAQAAPSGDARRRCDARSRLRIAVTAVMIDRDGQEGGEGVLCRRCARGGRRQASSSPSSPRRRPSGG